MNLEEAARYKEYWYNKYAQDYSNVVNTNRPWKWRNIPGGASLTAADKVAIKGKAVEQGLIPQIQMKTGTRYADFQGAGVVERTEPLPENLWKAKDREQFNYLDDLIGGRSPGHWAYRPGGR